MAVDPSFIGSVINALPLDRMIAGPLNAMVNAQVQATKAYADFLLSVCIKEGKAVNVTFEYDETLVDSEGNYKGLVKKTMRIPLLAAITHPNICIEEGSVDFELEVSQASESKSETSAELGFEATIGWGPVQASITGKVSHNSAQTRSTDTRAKYSIHTTIRRQPPTEALMRVIDYLTDAATKPTVTNAGQPIGENEKAPVQSEELITDNAGSGDPATAGAAQQQGSSRQPPQRQP